MGRSATNGSRVGDHDRTAQDRPAGLHGYVAVTGTASVRVKFGREITMFGRRMINWKMVDWRFRSEHAIASRNPGALAAGIYLRWLF